MNRTLTLFGGLGLGAALVYYLDHREGRRRRARLSDRLRRLFRGAPGSPGRPRDRGFVKAQGARIPLWLEVGHTAFVAVLVPVYWRYYGPQNFLWFSDLALFLAVPALWLESPLLAGAQAISVGLLELGWLADFLAGLLLHRNPLGLSRYMRDPALPRAVRALSLFHVELPLLLGWLVWRLGYDRRSWWVQSALAWAVLPACYLFTEPSANINWVFGPGDSPQHRLPRRAYLALVMALFPLGVYLPTHLLLRRLFPAVDAPGLARTAGRQSPRLRRRQDHPRNLTPTDSTWSK